MTSEDAEPAKIRVSALTCLFCDAPRLDDKGTTPKEGENLEREAEEVCVKETNNNCSHKGSCHDHDHPEELQDDSIWVCPNCQSSEQDRTKALESALLLDGTCENQETLSKDVLVAIKSSKNGAKHDGNGCACQACAERRELEEQQEQELHVLQKSWVQLRYAVRQMYRDGLDKEGKTGKGKQFHIPKLKDLVSKLCSHDPHQLYQRLESQGREYVMELKVNLLQVLVSPEKVGIQPAPVSEQSGTVPVTLDQAKYFLKATLDSFSQFQETVRNMHVFMQDLDRTHLEKFGITWKVVHHHLFDSVVYQDPLIQNSIPAMSAVLKVELTWSEDEGSPKKTKEEMKDLPPAAYELAQSFRALHRLMTTSRQIWDKAYQRMEDYTAKQMKLYKATLKAKQKMLREDLEFFKQQRRLLEEYVSRSKDKDADIKKTNSEEDLAHFAETLRNFLSGSRPGRQHSATTIECLRCRQKHCPCDECAISHVITCGLVTEDDQDMELPASMLEELPKDLLNDMEDLDQSSYSTGTSSDSEDDDSHSEEITGKFDTATLESHIVCRKRTTIICSDGKKVTKASTAIIPSTMYSSTVGEHTNDVQQHLYHAYGDWEVPWDPVARTIPGLPFDLYYRRTSDSTDTSSQSSGRSSTSHKDDKTSLKEQAPQIKEKTLKDVLQQLAKRTGDETGGGSGGKKGSEEISKPEKTAQRSSQGQQTQERPRSVPAQAPPKPPTQCTNKAGATPGAKPACDHHAPACKNAQGKQYGAKAYADLVKIFKEEGIAKALTIAAARKAKSGELKEADLDKIDWKDLNIDPEAVRKLCAQHMAVHGEPKPPTPKDPNAEKKEQTSVATQVDSFDDDEDSWSDRSSLSQKDGKHCDCCYCEMFGHGGVDFKNYGRDEYPQIRERLRLKLKQKKTDTPSSERCCKEVRETEEKREEAETEKSLKSLDEILEFINGPDTKQQREVETGGGASASKLAKRLRQKQKKAEDRLLKQQKEEEKKKKEKHRENTSPRPQEGQGTPKKKWKKKQESCGGGTKAKVSVEEVFQPREDLECLDEVDRDVENFKSKSEIDFFNVPATQVAIERGFWSTINPMNTVTNAGPYEFHIPPDPHFLDLSKNYIYLKLKITRANGQNLRAAPQDRVAPINMIGKTLFKQCKLFLNSKLLYDSGDTYAYRTVFETELNHSEAQKTSFLQSCGYIEDNTPNHIDDNQNRGWGERLEWFENSVAVEFMAPLHVDIFHQEKYLLNGMDLRLELHRHDEAFALMYFGAGVLDYKIEVMDIRWMIRKVELAKSISLAVESTLRQNTVKYPVRRVQIKAIQIAAGRRDTPINAVFSGQIPRRMVIGLVDSDAFHGTWVKSPFNFQNYNARSIQVTAGGVDFPATPLTMDYRGQMYIQPYIHLHEALGLAGTDKGCWITMNEYVSAGHCLYAFDLSPDNSGDGTHWELLKEGTTTINMQFRDDIPVGGVKMIVFAEFDNMISIDRFRNVYYDFSP